MDVDDIPATPLNCFICEGPETPAQKLAQATPKGYPTLLAYAEAVGNATMLEHMKKAWNVARLRYHIECKRDLYNKSAKATLTSSSKVSLLMGITLSVTLAMIGLAPGVTSVSSRD